MDPMLKVQVVKTMARLWYIYDGAKTKRFHTADTLTSQTVGEHSFGVAWLVQLLDPLCRKEVVLAALSHDLAEHKVGDVSSVAKREYPSLKSTLDMAEAASLRSFNLGYEEGLSVDEKRLLKLADLMDGLMFCIRERSMGSRVVVPIYRNFHTYIRSELKLSHREYLILRNIHIKWREVNASK